MKRLAQSACFEGCFGSLKKDLVHGIREKPPQKACF
jgi:hypothetical protein